MNVKGMRAMGIATPAVGEAKLHPSDWRRSADPEVDVEARLPCYMTGCEQRVWVQGWISDWRTLHTRAPAPAATIAAAVLTLNVL